MQSHFFFLLADFQTSREMLFSEIILLHNPIKKISVLFRGLCLHDYSDEITWII